MSIQENSFYSNSYSKENAILSKINRLDKAQGYYETISLAADIMEEINVLSKGNSSNKRCMFCLEKLQKKVIEICSLNRLNPKYQDLYKLHNCFVQALMATNQATSSVSNAIIPIQDPICRGINHYTNNKYTRKIVEKGELKTLMDVKVLDFASRTGLPCHYEEEIKAIVPNRSSIQHLQNTWTALRNPIRDVINVELPRVEDVFLWKNSAESIDELLQHEQIGGEKLLTLTDAVVKNAGGKAFFGPNNINLTKSRDSIESKIKRTVAASGSTEFYAIQHIDDGVRGTIAFRNAEEMKKGLQEFVKISKTMGLIIDSSNIWNCDDDYSGYLDVDFRIKIPLDKEGKMIMAELQFHLEEFYDGTHASGVSRAHKVYEIIRMIPTDQGNPTSLDTQDLIETSRLFFTVALFFQTLRT